MSVRQRALDPKHLIFLDQTAATTKMTRTHGRCLRGQRLLNPVRHGPWKTSTLVAGLCLTGITAPYVMDGAMTGGVFLHYIKQIRAPMLTAGNIVVIDNVAPHKVVAIRDAMRPAVRRCSTWRPTVLISPRSRKPSPRSRPLCARSAPAPATLSGRPSLKQSKVSLAQSL